MKVIGHYKTLAIFPDTYVNQDVFGRRDIPEHIQARGPVGRLKNCCQVLIKSIGTGYDWININNSDFTPA